MNTYFKAVRPDGGSFARPGFKWATETGGITTLENPLIGSQSASKYLSVSTVATDCTGMEWPLRLLEVEPVGETWVPDSNGLPNKVAGGSFRTVRELPAYEAFGPYGVQVVAILDRCSRLTVAELYAFATRYAARDTTWYATRYAAWVAAWDAARDAARSTTRYAAREAAWHSARNAAWDATWNAARSAARNAAWDATLAWLVKDQISEQQFATLTEAWNAVTGDDK